MDKEHDINQLSSDLNKIMNMFRKVESSTLDDVDNLKEELGDILLHVIFQTQIGIEHNRFNVLELLEKINSYQS